MLSLHDLQRGFRDAVLNHSSQDVIATIEGRALSAQRRLAIYANNVRINFTSTLEAAFPVVRELGGADWFEQIAHQYMRAAPSRSGSLHGLGAQYPQFLAEQLAQTQYDWFADVAQLEWAYQDVLTAADAPTLDIARLAHVTEDQYGLLRFRSHPAARVIMSRFPILTIWRAHRESGRPEDITLDHDECVLVRRRSDHVELSPLDVDTARFATLLMAGTSLDEAANAVLCNMPDWDLARALQHLLQRELFTNFDIDRSPGELP